MILNDPKEETGLMRRAYFSCLFDCFGSQKHSVEEMWETRYRDGISREILGEKGL